MVSYGIDTVDGTYGRKLFYEARGYTVTDCYNQSTDNIITGGFSFAQYKSEIDAGRPVMLNLNGHTIVGVGYDDSTNTVYIHDTWDYLPHTMVWGGSYSGMQLLSVSIVNLQGSSTFSVASFSINNAAPSTTSTTVTLNNTVSGSTPTYYMASESSSFSGATWLAYSAAPSFTLSAGGGSKTVYFKVKNSTAESAAVNDTIQLIAPPAVTSFWINNGAASTSTRSVILSNTTTEPPTSYMASESSSFSGATWRPYLAAASFTLSAANGTKTVYFKVKGATGISTPVSASIVLAQLPTVTSFKINSGAKSTINQTVTLNNLATLSPTQYMASEDPNFTLATWQAYSTSPKFTLSAVGGTKTIYFKVKNSAGESIASSDTILLIVPPSVTSFQINNGAATTTNRIVTLSNVATDSPTQCMASQSSTFSGATWKAYSTAPSFTLSAGNGAKTVYFKLKNTAGASNVMQATITLN